MKLTEEQLRELAKQLRCPTEDGGLEIAEMMSVTNANIITKAVKALDIKIGDTILEIGPGNGEHIENIMNVEGVNYHGADISPTMVDACNAAFSGKSNVQITLTNGKTLPYPDSFFDKVFTVNTIYFWENAQNYACEIARVMKPGGTLSIGYIPERVMKNIPFAKYGFSLYSEETVTELLQKTGLIIENQVTESEIVTGNSGQQIEREFVVISAIKR